MNCNTSSIINLYKQKLNQLFLITKTPVSIIDAEGATLYSQPSCTNYLLPPHLLQYYLKEYKSKNQNMPYMHKGEIDTFVGMFPLTEEYYLFLGPSMSRNVSISAFAEKYDSYVSRDELRRIRDVCIKCAITNSVIFSNVISMAYELIHHNSIDAKEILDQNFIVFSNDMGLPSANSKNYAAVASSINYAYDFENKLISAIIAGNKSTLEQLWVSPMPIIMNDINSNINVSMHIIVSYLVLMRHASVDGGANTTEAYSLYDKYIKYIYEKNIDTNNIQFLEKASYEFCALTSTSQNLGPFAHHAKLCEHYISAHLGEKITIRDLAIVCGISDRQICRIFSECYNSGVNQYINNERIRHAKLMLTNDNVKISEVSDKLGFASQSHFTKTFQKLTGYTPKQYIMNIKQ